MACLAEVLCEFSGRTAGVCRSLVGAQEATCFTEKPHPQLYKYKPDSVCHALWEPSFLLGSCSLNGFSVDCLIF